MDGREEWLDRLEAPSTTVYTRGIERWCARGCKWWTRIPGRSSLVRIRLGRGLLCPLITIHLSQAVEHFSGSTSGQCELQLHRLSTAPPHLTKPRATNCNPCKHDLRCSPADYSFPLPTSLSLPSFLPSFVRAPFLTIWTVIPSSPSLTRLLILDWAFLFPSPSSSSTLLFSPSISRDSNRSRRILLRSLSLPFLSRERKVVDLSNRSRVQLQFLLSRRAIVINNPDARRGSRLDDVARMMSCGVYTRFTDGWKEREKIPFVNICHSIPGCRPLLHRKQSFIEIREGDKDKGGREREKKKMDVCYAISSNGVCYLHTRRILLFFVRKNHEESLLFLSVYRG